MLAGGAAGLGLGIALARFVDPLLYPVKAAEWTCWPSRRRPFWRQPFWLPCPRWFRAVQIDPAAMLRAEQGFSARGAAVHGLV